MTTWGEIVPSHYQSPKLNYNVLPIHCIGYSPPTLLEDLHLKDDRQEVIVTSVIATVYIKVNHSYYEHDINTLSYRLLQSTTLLSATSDSMFHIIQYTKGMIH